MIGVFLKKLKLCCSLSCLGTLKLVLIISWCSLGHATDCVVRLGDTRVLIKQRDYGKGHLFIHLHQNEKTAWHAANRVAKQQGGRVLTLVHPGARNIVFHLGKSRYEFDPNRIFTDVGIKKTLTQFGPYTMAAHREVNKLASEIKKRLSSGKIIAVHNNQSYSLKDYLPGHSLANDARALHVNAQRYYRNFYLVTQQRDYMRLKKLKFNSIWQTPHAVDDGSLSVYLARGHYVNVEAGHDQLAAQVKMLRYA